MSHPTHRSVLLVEDDEKLRRTLELDFRDRQYEVYSAASIKEIQALPLDSLDFAVIDLRLGADNGMVGISLIKSKFPDCRIVMITGYGTISTAVSAMKLGAFSYLTKPFAFETLEDHLLKAQPHEVDQNPSLSQRESLNRHEREYIEFVLLKCGGNISRAAKWLNIHRQSLQRKLRKYPGN